MDPAVFALAGWVISIVFGLWAVDRDGEAVDRLRNVMAREGLYSPSWGFGWRWWCRWHGFRPTEYQETDSVELRKAKDDYRQARRANVILFVIAVAAFPLGILLTMGTVVMEHALKPNKPNVVVHEEAGRIDEADHALPRPRRRDDRPNPGEEADHDD